MSKKASLRKAAISLLKLNQHTIGERFGFIREWRRFIQLGGKTHTVDPILFEKTNVAGSAKGHYFHQDLLVASYIFEARPQRHIDIGSRIDGFVAHVAAFREIEVLDLRTLDSVDHPNIHFTVADLTKLDPKLENSSDSISCLHAIEHFGLGRYGDELNPAGHLLGFANMVKMLKPGGRLYVSFPIASQSSTVFNKHRIFHTHDIFSWPTPDCTLKLVNFDFVDDAGDLHRNVNLNTTEIAADYGCGIYTFEKITSDSSGNINPPRITFLMDPNHKEGAGSFYQRPFLASLMARSLGLPFVLANNPHSDCHYQSIDHQQIEEDWEKIFGFLGTKHQFANRLPNINPEETLISGQTYNAPFAISYDYISSLSADALSQTLKPAREAFLKNIERYPALLPPKEDGVVIALHLRDHSKGDPAFSTKTLLDWQMFSCDYGLPDNNPDYYSRLYANAVNQIIAHHQIAKPILHIHSTGEERSFAKLISLLDSKVRVKLYLSTHPPKSFVDLVMSDYLIASHSSFSWLASLLRKGPTYIRKNFRHFVTPETQIIEEVLYKGHGRLTCAWIRLKMKVMHTLFRMRS
jgi:SAM-dependent methyltransferase